jgi:hypothetical protein
MKKKNEEMPNTFRNVNCTKLDPSWKANSYSVIEEIPGIFLNSKVHYGVHKSPLLVFIVTQMNPAHSPIFL